MWFFDETSVQNRIFLVFFKLFLVPSSVPRLLPKVMKNDGRCAKNASPQEPKKMLFWALQKGLFFNFSSIFFQGPILDPKWLKF